MARFALAFLAALPLVAQTPAARDPNLADFLNFEAPQTGSCPAGWRCPYPATVAVDTEVVHGGKTSARIERAPDRREPASGIRMLLPVDFSGRSVELRGFVRTEEASGFCAFWMNATAADNASVGYASMEGGAPVKGTTPWTERGIALQLNSEARNLEIGFFLNGTGKAWVDDIQLLVDGKPIWEAPKFERPKTVLETDHEFDAGSHIAIGDLSQVQIANLATLGKVWGFLKYHHPRVTSGHRHFDYDLLRVLPAILAAPDRDAAHRATLAWIAGLGETPACSPCATLDEAEIHLRPELDWIADKTRLGADLSARLQAIRDLRPADGKQFYVSQVPNIGNPSFNNELSYNQVPLPDAGFQILALYRFWNIIQYWSPYRNGIEENWDAVLTEFLPRIALAKDHETYQRQMMALIARDHDTHANLWSSLNVRPPTGVCQLPVNLRFVDNQAVVWGYSEPELGKASGLKPGDVILDLDGVAVAKKIAEWTPYYADSNQAARLRDIAQNMTHGDCAQPAALSVRRETETLHLAAARVPLNRLDYKTWTTHDQPGETFRLISKDVAYLKLSSVKIAEVAQYVASAEGTKGLIIDIRNYPSAFMVFSLGQLLVDQPTPFARFTSCDPANPGAFHWNPPVRLTPRQPHYAGKIVILVDEISQSQAEYTTMALRTAPGAIVLGSTTAGADGDVSQIPLPGGLRTMISGIGVFYPDKRPTQRVGIVPDIEVKPTIAGIRAGRDELLEAAIRQIQ
jgi:C-terminal processing protease CtpA/Prc